MVTLVTPARELLPDDDPIHASSSSLPCTYSYSDFGQTTKCLGGGKLCRLSPTRLGKQVSCVSHAVQF